MHELRVFDSVREARQVHVLERPGEQVQIRAISSLRVPGIAWWNMLGERRGHRCERPCGRIQEPISASVAVARVGPGCRALSDPTLSRRFPLRRRLSMSIRDAEVGRLVVEVAPCRYPKEPLRVWLASRNRRFGRCYPSARRAGAAQASGSRPRGRPSVDDHTQVAVHAPARADPRYPTPFEPLPPQIDGTLTKLLRR